MSDEKRVIEVLNLSARSIEFNRVKASDSGDELSARLSWKYNWIEEDESNSKIEAEIRFQFEPNLLFEGKIVYDIEIHHDEGKITEEDKESLVSALEQQLGCISSFVTTVCGEAITGLKFIIPPILKSAND